ncbi:MAG: single-stranded DNA-binding protein [Selenomonadaceae bacterium]|nr:single-stranded DNA-binding protein [Selenomonadaceae bacterium]
MNKVILCGNLTRDVDLKSGNTTYARIGLAVNRPRSTKKEVDFFNLVAFGKTAEVMAKYLSKGSKILVEGQLRFSQYEDKNGQKQRSTDILIENVEFLDSKKKAADDDYFGGTPINNEDTPF